MNALKKIICIVFLFLIFSGCQDFQNFHEHHDAAAFTWFQDIPGVTAEEIQAIEALREEYDYFVYSVLPSTVAFYDSNGEIRGWSALFCEWMTQLFDIPFVPTFVAWEDFLTTLESFEADFTGAMTATEERRQTYLMTDAISRSVVQYFRLPNRVSLDDIKKTRLPRYAFIEGTNTINQVSESLAPDSFVLVTVRNFEEAYDALVSGSADAFFNNATAAASFDAYGTVVSRDFFPLIYSPVSLSTQNPSLEPIISVVQKALDNGALRHFNEQYNQGHQEYLRTMLNNQFTEEEREFIRSNPFVPILARRNNYPFSFYNNHEKEWQGIAFDILDEIESLTGLTFRVAHHPDTAFSVLHDRLVRGEAPLITELTYMPGDEAYFIWSSVPFAADRYTLISRMEFPNISVHDIEYLRVGIVENTANEILFRKWFPKHEKIITFENNLDKFNALSRGEIDVAAANQSQLLLMTHYHEQVGYKLNLVLNYDLIPTFGFNKNATELHSIFEKALFLIDIEPISERWLLRVFDYRTRISEAQRPWILGAAALLFCVLVLLLVMLIISRITNKRAKRLVEERTSKLEAQTSLLTTLIDHIPACVFTKDLKSNYTMCNKYMLEYFGITESDILEKDDYEALGIPSYLTERFKEVDRTVIRERQISIVESLVPSMRGTDNYYQVSRVPLIQNGEAVGILGIVIDTTARKDWELAKEAEYEYATKLSASLAKITNHPIVFADKFLAAVKVILKEGCLALGIHHVVLWQISDDRMALKNIARYNIHTEDYATVEDYSLHDHPIFLHKLTTSRLLVMNSIEDILRHSEVNEEYHAELCALLEAPIRIEGELYGLLGFEQEACERYPKGREWTLEERHYASSLADLTAIVISNSERRNALNDAEAANRSKSEFLANMSHEIRTPMNSIVGFSELAMYDDISPRTRDYLSKICENSEWLLQIINDILDISKIESGKMKLEEIPFDLQQLLNSCRTMIMPKVIDKNLTLHFYAEPSVGRMPVGDPTRLRQVFVNLLSNAVKFTNSGIIKLIAVIRKQTEKTVTMQFEIKDSGIGMTGEQIKRIFDPFIQAESGTTRKYGGTGLGLSITKNIIESMGGNLVVESIPGIGSKFSFELTFNTIDTNKAEVRSNKAVFSELEKPAFEGEILLCEDNAMNQQVICEHLGRVGLKPVIAENGKIGLTMVENRINKGEKPFDLIFMDIHMPVMDGLEAADKILKLKTGSPIVALTANIMAHDRELYKATGMTDFLGKPFTSQELWHCLMKYFEPVKWQNQNENQSAKEENELRGKLIKSFIKNNKNKAAEISEAIKASDIKLAHRLAHTLRGNAAQLNKTILQKAAEKLERDLKAGNVIITPAQLEALEIELNAVIMELTQHATKFDSFDFEPIRKH